MEKFPGAVEGEDNMGGSIVGDEKGRRIPLYEILLFCRAFVIIFSCLLI